MQTDIFLVLCVLRNFAVYPELVGLGQVRATGSTYLLWVVVSVPVLLSKALQQYPDLPTHVLPTASLGPLRWCMPWLRSQIPWCVVWSQELIKLTSSHMASSLVPEISLVLSDPCASPCWSWCYSYPAPPWTSNDGIASWAEWREAKEKREAGGARPSLLELQQLLRLEGRFLSPALWAPGDPAAAAPTTTSAGGGLPGGWGMDKPKKRGKGGMFHPSLSFPLSEPMLESSSWGSGHISAYSWLDSLIPAQGTPLNKRDQEPSVALMVLQNLVYLPAPSTIICLSGSHAPVPGAVSTIHNFIPWERHTEYPSSVLPGTRTPPTFWFNSLHLNLYPYKMCFDVMRRLRFELYNVAGQFPNITECAVHLSCRLFYRCVSFESPMNCQRKLWWDHFS